jgi:ferredoxin-thioredoxin reductase catalytic subunit
MNDQDITPEHVEALWKRLHQEAEAGGYYLNPDEEFTRDLVRSLIVNQQRYGYQACPCRLAAGEKNADLDIICPCDYRDADVAEYGACYCGLYVSKHVVAGKKSIRMIPERRPSKEERAAKSQEKTSSNGKPLALPVWRCRVCGYLCARDAPPDVCPICKAKKERFERFM